MKKEKSMRSFKDYTPQSSPQDESEILKEAATAPDPAMESSAAELTKKIAAAFNGKSNSDMLRSILGEAEKSKRAGTLSNAEIDTFYEQFSPLLNNVQRRQLKSVVERLKRIRRRAGKNKERA